MHAKPVRKLSRKPCGIYVSNFVRHYNFYFEHGVCDGWGEDAPVALAQCLKHMEEVYGRQDPPIPITALGYLERSVLLE